MSPLIMKKLSDSSKKLYTIKCAARFGQVAWRKGDRESYSSMKDLLELEPWKSEFYTRC